MANAGESAPVQFIDNPQAPEFFSSDASGFFVHEGVVHITFESARVNHVTNPAPINRVVIGRLSMPVAAAQRLAVGLYDFLKKQGLDPAPVPSKSSLQ